MIPPILFYAYYSGVVISIYYEDIVFLHGMVELLLLSSFIIYLYNLKIRVAILSGLIGLCIMSINMYSILLEPPLEPPDLILEFFDFLAIILWVTTGIILSIFIISKVVENMKNYCNTRKTILDLGTQFTRLEIKEISEKTKKDGDLIIRIIKSMIANIEIYGEYFSHTKTLVVNQHANLEQLEQLLTKIDISGEKNSKNRLFKLKVKKKMKYSPILLYRICFNIIMVSFIIANLFSITVHFYTPAFMYLIFGGLFGILCFLYLLKLLQILNIKKAIKYGIFGCCLLGLNLLILFMFRLIGFGVPQDLSIIYNLDVIFLIIFGGFMLILTLIFRNRKELEFEAIIRKKILSLGTNYTRLKISEVSEKTNAFQTTIVSVVKTMIENKEIFAEYFENSQSLAFNLQANIDEIDKLMMMYHRWETNRMDKKLI
ncbi:MAG: hypothetical protein ACFFCC_19235 [Promethearchaeota archaeon]